MVGVGRDLKCHLIPTPCCRYCSKVAQEGLARTDIWTSSAGEFKLETRQAFWVEIYPPQHSAEGSGAFLPSP